MHCINQCHHIAKNFKSLHKIEKEKQTHLCFQQSVKLLRTGPIWGLAHCQLWANDLVFFDIINSQMDETQKLPCSPWNFQLLFLFSFLSLSTSILIPKAIASQIVQRVIFNLLLSCFRRNFLLWFCFLLVWSLLLGLVLYTKGVSRSYGPITS